MLKEKESNSTYRIERLYSLLPRAVRDEIRGISRSVADFNDGISEVRLRSDGACALVLSGQNYPLISRISAEEMEATVVRLCEGALYAYRHSIGSGYIAAGEGIRVGVAGVARYEGGTLVGVDDISSLVFRLPASRCDFGEDLYRRWVMSGEGNMIIASPPLGGKTTALGAMARHIGSGRGAKRVVIVDERCEFEGRSYEGASVDLLRGYRREVGVELAVRTMSAQVIIVDEILSSAEASAVCSALGTGVTVITSAHAANLEGLKRRECLRPLFESGEFDCAAIIWHREGRYGFDFYNIGGEA